MIALLIAAIIVFVFTGVCIVKFLIVLADSAKEQALIDKWWTEHRAYQERSAEAARFIDSSSLQDDTDSSGGAANSHASR